MERTKTAFNDLFRYFDESKDIWKDKLQQVANLATVRKAAVLVPLFWQDGELHVLLTKRSMKVGSHKGDVCFPGGGVSDKDKTIVDTALREAEEEIGLKAAHVKILGQFLPYLLGTSPTGLVLTHVVFGLIDYAAYRPEINKDEVTHLFSLPLKRFVSGKGYRSVNVIHPVSRLKIIAHIFDDVVKGMRFSTWGFTAQILVTLASFLLDVAPSFPVMKEMVGQEFKKRTAITTFIARQADQYKAVYDRVKELKSKL